MPIPYSRVFQPNSHPLALSNLAYERANVLYNLAALYCQLASSEDRSNGDGIKRAVAHFQVRVSFLHLPDPLKSPTDTEIIVVGCSYQNAAGVLSHLISSALPPLETSLPPNTTLPADLSEPFLKALQWLMLAQAQECFWQRAVIGTCNSRMVTVRGDSNGRSG